MPKLIRRSGGGVAGARAAQRWGFTLAGLSATIAIARQFEFYPTVSVMVGLACFAVVFAVNSTVHSYLILAYTGSDKVALNVGFYYMANAAGRLTGTLLSGVMYLVSGLPVGFDLFCFGGSLSDVVAAGQ